MKTRSNLVSTSLSKIILISVFLSGCASVPNIVPQLPFPGSSNSPAPVVGQDIAQANNFLAAGQRRDAAAAYFQASQNYGSPERERLIMQAAELAAVFKDDNLTQRYLSPLNFDQLSPENKARFRLIQAQLALNDRNYRETLRILPQRVNDIPVDLGKKILETRMSAAQSSGDKLALVQELVLQEPTLKEAYRVNLNQDRIWNHARQIPAFQLEEAKNSINHPIVKNWLSLAQLSRVAQNGPISKRQSLRGDLGRWMQNNTNHPGMTKALGLLNSAPTTTVTPYSAGLQKPTVKTIAQRPVAKKPVVVKQTVKPPVIKKPAIKIIPAKPVAPNTPAVKKPIVADPKVRSLYEKMKKQIQ